MLHGLLYGLVGISIVLQATVQILVIGREVKVTVPAQVKDDAAFFT
jgi:hypothetical protein